MDPLLCLASRLAGSLKNVWSPPALQEAMGPVSVFQEPHAIVDASASDKSLDQSSWTGYDWIFIPPKYVMR